MKPFHLFLLPLLFFAFSMQTSAQSDEQYFKEQLALAQQGDDEAQYNVGNCYDSGKGIKKDFAKAAEWYKKASDKGNPRALYSLAASYYYGWGVKKNKKKSLTLSEKAAELGYAPAQDNLGQDYLIGYNRPMDFEKGLEWVKKAANQGYAHSQVRLGVIYAEGNYVTKDYEQAVEWYKKAAIQGYRMGQEHLADCYYNGEGVAQDYEKAIEWYTKAAEQGSESAKKGLETLLAMGYGKKNESPAQQQPFSEEYSSVTRVNIVAEAEEERHDIQLASIAGKTLVADVDINIPTAATTSSKTFAVIIGNEDYQRVSKVDHALNDAKVFAEYCQKALGLPASNVRTYQNATFGGMMTALEDIKAIAEAYEGDLNVIFYYAGHGIPDESSRSAFLLPVDIDGSQTRLCLSVDKLYGELASLNAHRVMVIMDACFSGSQRGEGMLAAARGVAIKAKTGAPQGNMIVLTAATGDQTAYPYKEKGHGLFTYYLLKKLQDSKGTATLGELCDFVSTQVKRQSVVINRNTQTPTFTAAPALGETWRTWQLK